MEILGQHFSLLEVFGTLSGIAGVWLTIRKNILCFPAGLINVGLYGVLFFKERLYADAALQAFYVILLIYGWAEWKKTSIQSSFKVSSVSRSNLIVLGLICLLSTMLFGQILDSVSDASLPYLDSFLASMSLIAQWLVAKIKIENWIVWIVADVLYVGLYLFKGLHLTAVLYFIFILLAIKGYSEWEKNISPNA